MSDCDGLFGNSVADEVVPDIDVFGMSVEGGIVGGCNCRCVVRKNSDWLAQL